MVSVGLKALRSRLGEYARLVASGETVLVTDRGRVVAELRPPRAGRSPWTSDPLLAEAVREGYITPPRMVCIGPPPSAPVAKRREVLRELERDRSER